MRIEEWLLAGEYILANENNNLLFCERGIRTFETYTRNTLDLSTIPIIKRESHCPIVIDPSQGAGRADLVAAMCKVPSPWARTRSSSGSSRSRRSLERRPPAAVAGRVRQTDARLHPFIAASGRNNFATQCSREWLRQSQRTLHRVAMRLNEGRIHSRENSLPVQEAKPARLGSICGVGPQASFGSGILQEISSTAVSCS